MNIAPLKVSLLSLALLLSPVASLPAHAACTANLALQPASSLPALGGRLELPGMRVIASAMPPPVQDSAVLTCSPR